jgi:1,4-dihydroxy-2-naphthoate octaprenyltransferase
MSSPQLSTWILAARPKTLPAAAAPVLIGYALAIGDSTFALVPSLAVLIAALLIQIGTNYANDYYDFVKGTDTATRLGPTRVTQAGLVTPAQMKRATGIVFGVALLIGLYLVLRTGWPILVIGVLSILFGLLYTAGPYPLGYNGLGDIFVLIFFGPVAVAGTYYVNLGYFSVSSIVAGLIPGLYSVGILTVNNLRDLDNDHKAGKRTLAVRFGRSFARAEFVFCLFAPHLVTAMLAISEHRRLALLSLVTMVPAVGLVRRVWSATDGPSLNNALAATGRILLIHSLVFSIGWVLL